MLDILVKKGSGRKAYIEARGLMDQRLPRNIEKTFSGNEYVKSVNRLFGIFSKKKGGGKLLTL